MAPKFARAKGSKYGPMAPFTKATFSTTNAMGKAERSIQTDTYTKVSTRTTKLMVRAHTLPPRTEPLTSETTVQASATVKDASSGLTETTIVVALQTT